MYPVWNTCSPQELLDAPTQQHMTSQHLQGGRDAAHHRCGRKEQGSWGGRAHFWGGSTPRCLETPEVLLLLV